MIRNGSRRTLQGPVQVHLCKDCGKTSSDRPIPYLNTRSILVLRGISLYNQGYSLGQCSTMLKQAFKETVPRNTIHYWTKHYRDVFPYLRKRRRDEPRLPLVTRRFNDFNYSYHRRKVMDIGPGLTPLKEHLMKASWLPRSERPSSMEGTDTSLMEDSPVLMEDPPESRMARLITGSPPNEVYRAILINDGSTVCKMLPVLKQNGEGPLEYDPIPLVQVRGRKIRLLTFHQGTEVWTEVISNLVSKAKALSLNIGVPLTRFELGWFDTNEMVYYDLSLKKHY